MIASYFKLSETDSYAQKWKLTQKAELHMMQKYQNNAFKHVELNVIKEKF